MQRISSEWPLDSDESLPKTRFFIDASFRPVVAFPVLFFFCLAIEFYVDIAKWEKLEIIFTFDNAAVFGAGEKNFFVCWNDSACDSQAVAFQLVLNRYTFILELDS